jgi:carbon-monoxide dehydrogenase small subunit
VDNREVRVVVNGRPRRATVPTRLTLADFLRDTCGLTGTHVGCEYGACGACTVLMDGEAVRACLVLAVQADAADVTTVEGLATAEALHPVQEAFRSHQALQCGFCTPGFLVAAVAMLNEGLEADEQRLGDWLGGHICRCTGYGAIVGAVQDAARVGRGATPGDPAAGRPRPGSEAGA